MFYALKEALTAFKRAPILTGLSAAMIALSLLVVALFGITTFNIKEVLDRMEARVEVVAYLHDDADPIAVRAAQQEIQQLPQVRVVRYVSKQQALETARRELSEFRAIFSGLDTNPLPASIEIALLPNQQGPAPVKRIADRVATYPFVEDVRYGQDWLDKVYLLRRVAAASSLVLGGAFAIVAALIIGAAVRLAVFARRDEIAIMRLVGATDGFIRRPFVLEGFLTGTFGALLALLCTYLIYRALSRSLIQLEWLPDIWVAALLAAGALLGSAASAIAVRRHLRAI